MLMQSGQVKTIDNSARQKQDGESWKYLDDNIHENL